jgi:hypothetical protein
MKAIFELEVDFMRNEMEPPTLENCKKCGFYGELCNAVFTHETCDYGRNGYFSPGWKEITLKTWQ